MNRYYCRRSRMTDSGMGHTGEEEEAVIEAAGKDLIRRVISAKKVDANTKCYDWRTVPNTDAVSQSAETEDEKDNS